MKKFFSQSSHLSVNEEIQNRLTELQKRVDDSCTARDANSGQLFDCNDQIDRIQNRMIKDLNPFVREELKYANHKSLDRSCDYMAKISELDTKDSRSELEEIELEKQKLQSKLDHTEFVKGVLNNYNVSVPQDERVLYSELQQNKPSLLANDRTLTEEHLTNVMEYITASEQANIENNSSDSTTQQSSAQENRENIASDSTTQQPSVQETRDNSGSLIDDFADPSTEQPSHMDPDD